MIYPPILASTQPAFLVSERSYQIYFSLPSIVSEAQIGHIQVSMVRQNNNKSIITYSDDRPDRILQLDWNHTKSGNLYYISVPVAETEGWTEGTIYKIQMRFGMTAKFDSSTQKFAEWKQKQIEDGTFSEWSTVMLAKAIAAPTLEILNKGINDKDITDTEPTESSLTPLFTGLATIPPNSKEGELKYQFQLFVGDETSNVEPLDSSGWLLHNSNTGESDSYRFNYILTALQNYTVTYQIITTNGYTSLIEKYSFMASRTYYGKLENMEFEAISDTPYNRDNGCIQLYLNRPVQEPFSGNLVIIRTSEASNFEYWEDIKYIQLVRQNLEHTLCFTDYSIESGIRYRYAVSEVNRHDIRTNPIIASGYHSVDFEYAFLYCNGVQYRFQFDQKISSFKHTVQRTKQDTLGDKYPHLVQNGNSYYAEFPISGLISYQGNADQDLKRWQFGTMNSELTSVSSKYPNYLDTTPTFFTPQSDGMYYKGEKVIDKSRFSDSKNQRGYSAEDDSQSLAKGFDHYRTYGERGHFGSQAEDGFYTINDNYPNANDTMSERFESKYLDGQSANAVAANTKASYQDNEFEAEDSFDITTDINGDNIYIERVFREKVEEFLNDFTYKLYKSPTEGNITIGLMNVTLSPVSSLGRMLYSFSATAYEVADHSLGELNSLGIISIGEYEELTSDEIVKSFGQVGEFYYFVDGNTTYANYNYTNKSTDIYAVIEKQEEVAVGDKYHAELKYLSSIQIEPYPRASVQRELAYWQKELAKAIVDGKDITEIQAQLERYTQLQTVLTEYPASAYTKFRVNNNGLISDIMIAPNKTYTLEGQITSLDLVAAVAPIQVNYIAVLSMASETSAGVASKIQSARPWGQIAGIFTEDGDTLQSYNFNYEDSATGEEQYQVFDIRGQDYNFKVYKTQNIYAAILDQCRLQVQKMYNTTFEWNGTEWTDGVWRYAFGDIVSISIEAQAGTVLKVGRKKDGSDAERFVVGAADFRKIVFNGIVFQTREDKTNVLILSPLDGSIGYITLEKGAYVIVDYICTTSQTMG